MEAALSAGEAQEARVAGLAPGREAYLPQAIGAIALPHCE